MKRTKFTYIGIQEKYNTEDIIFIKSLVVSLIFYINNT